MAFRIILVSWKSVKTAMSTPLKAIPLTAAAEGNTLSEALQSLDMEYLTIDYLHSSISVTGNTGVILRLPFEIANFCVILNIREFVLHFEFMNRILNLPNCCTT